jgi:polysaccharide deacetylase family protein (PEP-CTERM system associated)
VTAATAAFTVDVEDWFHICGIDRLAPAAWDALPSRVVDTTRRVLEELDDAAVRATFFVLGWVAERHPQLVAEISSAGHEIGTHGHFHQRVYELDRQAFVDDLHASVRALHAAGVEHVTAYRAPEWSINDRSLWALDELSQHRFQIDASMAPLRLVGSIRYPRHPHLRQTCTGAILECPPLVADRFGQVMPIGWGWGLRMSAPRRVLSAIEAANACGFSPVLMVHPWELDPDPPRVSLPARAWFAHYFRLEGFLHRLRVVLRNANFGPLGAIQAARRN